MIRPDFEKKNQSADAIVTLKSLYPFCAPVLLIMVACLQLYFAHFHHLTPWKGGGFGMFSTIDSQKNRFLRCYLITDEGDIPVEVPRTMTRLADQIRSLPIPELMSQLANKLAHVTWVSYNYNDFERTVLPDTQAGEARERASIDKTQWHFRVREADEPDPSPAEVVNFYGVRVELWGQDFDIQNMKVVAYKILETKILETISDNKMIMARE
jgi:hypothetical protein